MLTKIEHSFMKEEVSNLKYLSEGFEKAIMYFTNNYEQYALKISIKNEHMLIPYLCGWYTNQLTVVDPL